MINLRIRSHPEVLFGYSNNYVEMILRVENEGEHPMWVEADISVPENLSLAPNAEIKKGRIRVGIVGNKEFLEKAVRVYADSYTSPQVYKSDITIYVFNKDGIIESRMEKSTNLRCEIKKEESL